MITIGFYCSHCAYHDTWRIAGVEPQSVRQEDQAPAVLCPECHEPLALYVKEEEENDADATN